jgi:hypothetical protein
LTASFPKKTKQKVQCENEVYGCDLREGVPVLSWPSSMHILLVSSLIDGRFYITTTRMKEHNTFASSKQDKTKQSGNLAAQPSPREGK